MEYKALETTLQTVLSSQSKPRNAFLAILIHALFQARSVNLSKLAGLINPKVDKESNERRCSRYLETQILQNQIGKLILTMIGFFAGDDEYILCMDRTNWKFGKLNINFLTIGIAYLGYALPLGWVNLEKAGNSNSVEREKLLLEVLKLVPKERIYGFAADREFIGKDWFSTLFKYGINQVIRIRADTMIQHRQIKAPAAVWFRDLKGEMIQELTKARVYGMRVFVIGTLTDDGELLVLVTQKRPSQALKIYRQRWQIECLFKALKSSGFNIEDTHITNTTRLEALFGVLAIGVAWCVVVGELVRQRCPEKVKTHGRLAVSLFKRGFDALVEILVFGESKYVVKDEAFMLLSGT
jgi:Transposase DDE domain